MPIIPYLKYLREMSRKILMNKGFENVLYRKPKNQDPFYSEYPPPNEGYWLSVQARINDSQPPERTVGCFWGTGLIVGTVTRSSKNRKIAGPLLYAPVEIEQQEDSNTLQHFVLWEEITFNFDLLAILTDSEVDVESELTNENVLPMENNFMMLYKRIADLEDEIDKLLADPNFRDDSISTDFCQQALENLCPYIPILQACGRGSQFSTENLDKYMNRDRLTFFNHPFTFLAPLPDDLTSFSELRKLLLEAGGQ